MVATETHVKERKDVYFQIFADWCLYRILKTRLPTEVQVWLTRLLRQGEEKKKNKKETSSKKESDM